MLWEVSFHNVGRQKKSWTAILEYVTHETLAAEIKRARVLRSSGVSFDINHADGNIYAGNRPVGTFTTQPAAGAGN